MPFTGWQCQSTCLPGGKNATRYLNGVAVEDGFLASCLPVCAGYAAPVATCSGLDESHVNTVYQTVLGRAADAGGLTAYACKGHTETSLTAALMASDEYKTKHPADGKKPGPTVVDPGASFDLAAFVKKNGVLLAGGAAALAFVSMRGGKRGGLF